MPEPLTALAARAVTSCQRRTWSRPLSVALLVAGIWMTPVTPSAGASVPSAPVVDTVVPGATPFLASVTLAGIDTAAITAVRFSIAPFPGATTSPIGASYSVAYLARHGLLGTGSVTVPVFGLYASNGHHTNSVSFVVVTSGGSASVDEEITTTPWPDPSGGAYTTNLRFVATRNPAVPLDFSFMMIKSVANGMNPVVMDTDGEVRWAARSSLGNTPASTFLHGSFFVGSGTSLYRLGLDGVTSRVLDLSSVGVSFAQHHNIDPSPDGLLVEVNTPRRSESTIEVVSSKGVVRRTFDLAAIISKTMRAGGDDPSRFVVPTSDWFHNNSATYWPKHNELVVSSRENFVIALNYTTQKIEWILGDPTKAWHRYRSLRKLGLTLSPGSLPPVGQHSVSITPNGEVQVFDDGDQSSFEFPPGVQRTSSAPRSYKLNLTRRTASVVWSYDPLTPIWSPICGSVYQEGRSHLIDYSSAFGGPELIALGPNDAVGLDVRIQGDYTLAWNALPISLSGLQFTR